MTIEGFQWVKYDCGIHVFEKKVDFYLSNELDKNKKDNFMKFFIVNETSDKNLNKLFGFLERIIKPR